MPGPGYSTIGMKPSVITRLQETTNRNYPGMFLPSTLIIIMNEVKKGYYEIETHKIRLDLTGRYNTITIRSDVKDWLKENYEKLGEEYEKTYRVKCFTKFVSYFIINMLESKYDAQNHKISLKESEFEWLQKEYQKQKNNTKNSLEPITFEQFVEEYIKKLSEKINKAREILTI